MSFNELASEIIVKNSCVLSPSVGLKLFESEIDVAANRLVAFQKDTSRSNAKDWIIPDVRVFFLARI